jgi:hypothetical protein
LKHSAFELLGIDLDYSRLGSTASRVFKQQFITGIEKQGARLDHLVAILGESEFTLPENAEIPNIVARFKQFFRQNTLRTNFSNKRDFRTLTYALGYGTSSYQPIMFHEDELQSCIDLLRTNWRDSYAVGLCHSLLEYWEAAPSSCLEILRSFLVDFLSSYRGTRKSLSGLKANTHFFCRANGNLLLGAELARRRAALFIVTKELGVPESWIAYSYFSGVFAAYYEKRMQSLPDIWADLSKVLAMHNSVVTSKRILPRVIIQVDNGDAPHLRDDVKAVAFHAIGDPGIKARWEPFTGASASEEQNIRQGKEILNQWITQEFIKVFFEKCLNDPRRKKFWLGLSKQVKSFDLYGPQSVRLNLKMDKRISDYVDARFHKTDYYKGVAAFAMRIGNYQLIEFSDPGYAFYAYHSDNKAPERRFQEYKTVDSLRDGSMPYLVRRTGYELGQTRNEGRLSHLDGDMPWEDVFSYWLRKYVGIQA